ncbi:MAG TPA: acyl-CoA reductase [Vicinamibacterales bacterium]|nr:acyl-CoA reductase [Vicinamibacterales bacterium]
MSEMPVFGGSALALAYDLEARLSEWEAVRVKMARAVADGFTRDEWAYLVQFVSRANLLAAFEQSIGPRGPGPIATTLRPRSPIAVWLPNNVSALGPLVLVLASMTGGVIRVKSGSQSANLCRVFVDYLRANASGGLHDQMQHRVSVEQFDRHDPRNAAMAAAAEVRIAFGSDDAIQAIHALPHPPDSVGISFGDHQSEAWLEAGALDDNAIATMIKVFAIYGRAGCTSPRRAVLLDGTLAQCRTVAARLITAWPSIVRQDVPMHYASLNVMHQQLNASHGWEVAMAPRSAALVGVAAAEHPAMSGLLSLAIVPATIERAMALLPANIQTIGYCVADPRALVARLAQTAVKRVVPIAQMHHFGPVWDGVNFFRQMFAPVDVSR